VHHYSACQLTPHSSCVRSTNVDGRVIQHMIRQQGTTNSHMHRSSALGCCRSQQLCKSGRVHKHYMRGYDCGCSCMKGQAGRVQTHVAAAVVQLACHHHKQHHEAGRLLFARSTSVLHPV
jgi:hypothetical protein